MIPKVIHQIWIGTNEPPVDAIESWKDKNPSWIHIFWNEEMIKDKFPDGLKNQKQYEIEKTWHGKADILRYEILYEFGGFYIDADSTCLRALEDEFLDNDSFACYENETVREGLIANGYLGATKKNSLIEILIDEIPSRDIEIGYSYQTTGPGFLTEMVKKYEYEPLTVYPSWYFIPTHHTGVKYQGDFEPYCDQLWFSTKEHKAGRFPGEV